MVVTGVQPTLTPPHTLSSITNDGQVWKDLNDWIYSDEFGCYYEVAAGIE